MFLGPLALVTSTAALLAAPVAPALYELRNRRDAAPLPTARHDGRIANFAAAFQSRLVSLLPELERCSRMNDLSRISEDGLEVLLVGREDFEFDPHALQNIDAVMCGEMALIPSGRLVESAIYASKNLIIGEGAILRAALSKQNITLENGSTVLRWLHACGSVFVAGGSTACGRLSAEQSIYLERGSRFEHLSAPLIVTSDERCRGVTSQIPVPDPEADASQVSPDAAEASVHVSSCLPAPRIRAHGNFALTAEETLKADIVCTGELRFGKGARFFGSAKSYRDVLLEEDAFVQGSIVCGGTIQIGPRCFVAGPVMAERDVVIERNSSLGRPAALTTVSSHRARIAPGCFLHGAVFARARGIIED